MKTAAYEQLETKKLLSASGYADKDINVFMTAALADGKISRQEIVQVFRLAGDENRVDQNEFTDLKRIVAQIPQTNVYRSDPVKYLAESMFKSVANKGRNLKVGSTASDVNWLLDKHFLGKHYPGIHPSATYKPVQGQLFVNGPSSRDVDQGGVGNCYLMAGLASVADTDPQTIRDRFIDNNDGTWTVSFFSTNNNWSKSEHFVTVDNMLPTNSYGTAFYAGFGGQWDSPNNELWVGLIEKAYVQWNATGLTQQGNTINAYHAISGGLSSVVFNQLYSYSKSFVEVSSNMRASESKLIAAVNKGMPVVVSRYMNANRTSSHAYHVKSYSQGVFHLVNPWGHSDLHMTYQQMIGNQGRVFRIMIAHARHHVITVRISPITIPAKPLPKMIAATPPKVNPYIKFAAITIPKKPFRGQPIKFSVI
jgi:hypothetical protein